MLRTRSSRLMLTALGLIVLLIGACGEAEIVPAATHSLSEPWQANPFAVELSLISSAERICRDPGRGGLPVATPLVVVDARGANRLFLLFAAPTGDTECIVMLDAAGRLTTSGGGGSSGPAQAAIGPTQVMVLGSGSVGGSNGPNEPDDTTNHVFGRAGERIAAVELVLVSGASLRASLNGGWFAGWWPGNDLQVGVRAYDAGGSLIGSSP